MKKVPNLRFKEFSGEWEQTTLGKVTNGFEYGMNAAATEFDGENKYIRITDIDEITNKYLDNDVVSPSGILEDKYLVNDNDILFARTGASTGKTYLYNKEDGRLYFAGFLIRSNVNSLNNSKFIFLQTQNQEYKKWVKVTSMRSGQPGINSQEYASYSFYSPKLGEQEKIAAFFSLIDKKIELQTEKVEELKNYKKGLMQKIFSQELRFKDENGNKYPEWEEKKLGECLISRVEKQVPSKDAPLMAFTSKGGIESKGERYDRSFLVKDNAKTYKRTELNDFIYSSNNLDVGSMGLNKYGTAVISDVYEIFKIKDNVFPEVISLFLHKPDVLNKILKYRQGALYGQYRIHAEDFLKVNIKIPGYSEQEKIASFFSLIDKKLELEMERLEKLQEYKKGLLQQMFI